MFDATPNLLVSKERVIAESDSGNYFDAGASFVSRKAIALYQGEIPCSFNKLLSPAMSSGLVSYHLAHGDCYDIGTPERIERFKRYIEGKDSKR